jgi:hypothetical protein
MQNAGCHAPGPCFRAFATDLSCCCLDVRSVLREIHVKAGSVPTPILLSARGGSAPGGCSRGRASSSGAKRAIRTIRRCWDGPFDGMPEGRPSSTRCRAWTRPRRSKSAALWPTILVAHGSLAWTPLDRTFARLLGSAVQPEMTLNRRSALAVREGPLDHGDGGLRLPSPPRRRGGRGAPGSRARGGRPTRSTRRAKPAKAQPEARSRGVARPLDDLLPGTRLQSSARSVTFFRGCS